MMIGDRSHDVLAASAVGASSIGVLWGYGSRDELLRAGADHLVEEALELRLLVGV
jgi:phosphoglycolate phosphatase